MSERWRERAARNWARYLRSLLAGAGVRGSRSVSSPEGCLVLRREATATYVYLDAAERTGRYEVPERVLADPVVNRLAELQTDILAHCGAVHDVVRDEALGDTRNLVLVLEAASGLRREQVIEEIRHRVSRPAEEFQRLAAGVPAVCARLSCDPYERLSTERHLRAMTRHLRVAHDWSGVTGRHAEPTAVCGAGVPAP